MTDPKSFGELVALLREDRQAHGRGLIRWARPGLHAVFVYRLGRWQRTLPQLLRLPLAILYGILYWLVRMIYQIELPAEAKVGRRLIIGHQGGVVISHYATIGDDCLLRHNVTVGGRFGAKDAPDIGNRVSVAPGAAIIGAIKIGDDAVIGPNAVVMTDVPPGARVLAPVAQIHDDG